ncbi:MAG: hypothetical protein AUI36_07140 [Cyanobacteria bacterium 13_1_40CM_2_61_4]|nr:MAG: hypothetical protein AUI36_07140 [Cyanobacteria bacterium 13_1_40CM_2_61_4]
MRLHSRSIYGCTEAPEGFVAPPDSRLTYNPESRRLYVHSFAWPPFGSLRLEGLAGRVKYAQLLNDASEIRFTDRDGDVRLRLPVTAPDREVGVIELFL